MQVHRKWTSSRARAAGLGLLTAAAVAAFALSMATSAAALNLPVLEVQWRAKPFAPDFRNPDACVSAPFEVTGPGTVVFRLSYDPGFVREYFNRSEAVWGIHSPTNRDPGFGNPAGGGDWKIGNAEYLFFKRAIGAQTHRGSLFLCPPVVCNQVGCSQRAQGARFHMEFYPQGRPQPDDRQATVAPPSESGTPASAPPTAGGTPAAGPVAVPQTPPSAPPTARGARSIPPDLGSGGGVLDGDWYWNGNNHTAQIHFTENTAQLRWGSGRVEQLKNITFDRASGRVSYYRDEGEQRYTGVLVGDEIQGIFTQFGRASESYRWCAARRGACVLGRTLTPPSAPPLAPPTSTGPTTPSGAKVVNLARGKPATQSSVYRGTGVDQGPHFGVDGILEAQPRDPHLTVMTNADTPPWWQVDLQGVHTLTQLKLYNRTACCQERARTVQVLLSTDGHNWQKAYEHDGKPFDTLTVDLRSQKARFVRLQLTEAINLHFLECEVYGSPSGHG